MYGHFFQSKPVLTQTVNTNIVIDETGSTGRERLETGTVQQHAYCENTTAQISRSGNHPAKVEGRAMDQAAGRRAPTAEAWYQC